MSSKIHLIIPDTHAHFQHHNKRAEWLGKLINDVKPDVVIHMGDSADMPSLSSYDRGTRAFQGRSYRADIDAHLDFNNRLWDTVRSSKRKLPHRVFLEGNHEHRIKKAINLSPELEGAISFNDLRLDDFYDTVVEYNGRSPGVIEIDGISYAHFFISGVMGKSIGGTHAAYSILQKGHGSSTAGDLHLLSYDVQTGIGGRRIQGLVSGCYQDYDADWAGEANKLWWRGVVIKRGVDNGNYDPSFVSLNRIKKEYG
jgi:Calcineurin-like phosphoesterase